MTGHYTTVYRKDTGEIVSTGFFMCEDEMVDINFAVRIDQYGGQDHDVIDAPADPETQYVRTINEQTFVMDRPVLLVNLDKATLAADGVDFATLTGLPDPCVILIDDDDPATETTTIEVSGGGFEFSTEDPGPYSIEVRDRFPFLPFKIQIVAS